MGYETARYDVLYQENNFEIRRYHKHILAQTNEQSLSGSGGFNDVFNYITRNNQNQTKIAMTTPVFNDIVDEKAVTTAFVIPSQYTYETAPKPRSSTIKLVEVKEHVVAVVRFSQTVTAKKLQQKQELLMEWLKKHHVMAIGNFKLARYNPPFIPGFLKRNEIIIEVDVVSLENIL